MKTALLQFLLIVALGTGFAVVAARSLAGPSQQSPAPATAVEAFNGAPDPGELPDLRST